MPRRALIVGCLVLSLVVGLRAETVQSFTMRGAAPVRGVFLRDQPTGLLVATADGLRTLTRGSVAVPGQMTVEAQALDRALTTVAAILAGEQTGDLPALIADLVRATGEFTDRTEPELRSALLTDNDKTAIREARRYYAAQREALQPVVGWATSIREVRRLATDVTRGAKENDLALLTTLAAQYRLIAGLPAAPAALQKDAEQITRRLQELLRKCAAVLREDALTGLRAHGIEERCLNYLQGLKVGEGAGADFANEQAPLVAGIVEIVAARRAQLPERTRTIISFENGINLDQKPYLEARSDMQLADAFLDRVAGALFGPPAADLRAQLDAARRANDDQLANCQQLRDRLAALRDDYRRIEMAAMRDDYAAVLQACDAVLKSLAAERLTSPPLQADLEERRRFAQAHHYFTQLQAIDKVPPARLDDLLTPAAEFARKNQAVLVKAQIKPTDFELALTRAQNFRVFLGVGEKPTAFEKIRQETAAGSFLRAWTHALQMTQWLAGDGRDRIHPAAQATWQAFLTAHQQELLAGASGELLADVGDLREKDQQQLFASCFDYLLAQGRLAPAGELVTRGLANLRGTGAIFLSTLVTMQLRVAEAAALAHHPEQGRQWLEALLHDYAAEVNAAGQAGKLTQLLIGQAMSSAAGGDTAAAINLYEALCRAFPRQAQEAQVFASILRLHLEQRGLAATPDAPAALQVIDSYCARFSGHFANTELLRGIATRRIADFNQTWASNEKQAIDELLTFLAQYPAITTETELVRLTCDLVRSHLLPYLADEKKPVPATVFDGLSALLRPEYRRAANVSGLPRAYVQLRLRRAHDLVRVNHVEAASKCYEEVTIRFPDLAEEFGVAKTLSELRTRLTLEHYGRPLRIFSLGDWFVAVVWPVLWLGLLANAWVTGRREQQTRYYLVHFAVAFGVFAAFLGLLLYHDVGHGKAVLVAFGVPGVLFNVVGMTGYFFFPLVYGYRRMRVERWSLPCWRSLGLGSVVQAVERDVVRLRREIPLLHDSRLFLAEHALLTAETDPAKADRLFRRLLAKLDRKAAADHDDTWRTVVATCLLNLARFAWQQGRAKEAEAALVRYLKLTEQDCDARELLIDVLFSQSRYEEAIPHLKACLAARGTKDQLWYRLGRAFYETDKPAAAHKCLATVKEKDRDTLFYGAQAYARAGQHDQALEWYQQLLKHYPSDAEGVYCLATSLARRGEFIKALKLVQAIKPESRQFYPRGLALQATVLFRNNRLEQARECFQKALELEPRFLPALLGMGQLALQTNDRELARSLFRQVLEHDPGNVAANYFLAVLLQLDQPDQAIASFEKALSAPEFQRDASRRIGYLLFFRRDYAGAIGHFQRAEAAGESSPWFLYLCAYAFAATRRIADCRQMLVKILGHAATDPTWQERAGQALYSLAGQLADCQEYQLAHQCLEFVREHYGAMTENPRFLALMEEIRFRMVINLLARNEYVEAQNAVAMLQLETTDRRRFDACEYYLAICQLRQGDVLGAERVFASLAEQNPEQPRYLYHQLAAAVLAQQEVSELFARFAQLPQVPPHLRAGGLSLQALAFAALGEWRDAENTLARSPYETGYPGADYIRRRLLLARVYCRCRTGDLAGAEALLRPEHSAAERAEATRILALAAAAAGHLDHAYDLILPHAAHSAENRQLRVSLAAHRARQAIMGGRFAEAQQLLADLPPDQRLTDVQAALKVEAALRSVSDLAGVRTAITVSREVQEAAGEKMLVHAQLHNLGVLYLWLAVLLEETGESDVERKKAWGACIKYWMKRVFRQRDYWDLEQKRLTGTGQTVVPLTEKELQALSVQLVRELLLKLAESYVLSWLLQAEPRGVERHFDVYFTLAEALRTTKPCLAQLGEQVEQVMRNVDRTDARWDQWPFVICGLELQLRIAKLQSLPVDHLELELARQLDLRQRYPRPSDYSHDRKRWTTLVFTALQHGIQGDFTTAGQQMDEVFASAPKGLSLGPLENPFRLLREACRKPQECAERGMNLAHECEKLYSRARSYDFQQKAEDHANPPGQP